MTRPLPPMLPVDPAILCVWCIASANTSRAHYELQTREPLAFATLAESGDRHGDDSRPGDPVVLRPQMGHYLREFPGDPLGWSGFLAELVAQPRSWTLRIDMNRVGAAGVMQVSGTRVCASHLEAELRDRRAGYRR